MKNSRKTVIKHEGITQSGYHAGCRNGYTAGSGSCGFRSLKFFSSDRVYEVEAGYAPSEKMRERGLKVSGYGLEIEMVNRAISDGSVFANIAKNYIFAELPDDLVKFESDCTVDLECVTQVMSREFLRNNYRGFHQVFKRLAISGGTTWDERVGMHVNISLSQLGRDRKTQRENAAKLWRLFYWYDDIFAAAVGRTGTRQYCGALTSPEYDTMNSHGRSLNYSHMDEGDGRIEIRLVAGQRDFQAFRNTMEFIFFLCQRVKRIKNADKIDLATLFRGCNRYVVGALSAAPIDGHTRVEIISGADMTEDYTLHDA